MKNVFVTGHTSGIGLATYNLLQEHGYTVSGGSRSTGFDVADHDAYQKIPEDCDILINNAYHATGQLALLKYLYATWKGNNKIFINVGSAGKDNQKNRPFERLNYNVAKKSLEAYSYWISENDDICKSMMYNPGFVDTPLSRRGMNGWPESDQQQILTRAMDPVDCAQAILFMINSKHTVKELTHIY